MIMLYIYIYTPFIYIGQGDAPDNAQRFIRTLRKITNKQHLANTQYVVLSLGIFMTHSCICMAAYDPPVRRIFACFGFSFTCLINI